LIIKEKNPLGLLKVYRKSNSQVVEEGKGKEEYQKWII